MVTNISSSVMGVDCMYSTLGLSANTAVAPRAAQRWRVRCQTNLYTRTTAATYDSIITMLPAKPL